MNDWRGAQIIPRPFYIDFIFSTMHAIKTRIWRFYLVILRTVSYRSRWIRLNSDSFLEMEQISPIKPEQIKIKPWETESPVPGFVITAHRGASGLMPENTLGAIALAMKFGADYAEIDVHLTRDGEVVLLHDDSLSRTTTGKGKIWDYSLKELSGLDAGSWYAPQFNSERIPTLRDVIRLVKGKMKLDIEIKSHAKQSELPRRVIEVLEEENFIGECIITSFDREVLQEVRELKPEIPLGLISSVGIPSNVYAPYFDWFIGHATFVDRELVAHMHGAGKSVHVWTVNRPAMMRRFIRMGVDGIITDRPDLLRHVLEKYNGRNSGNIQE